MKYRLKRTLVVGMVTSGFLVIYFNFISSSVLGEREQMSSLPANKNSQKTKKVKWDIPDDIIKKYVKEAEAENELRLQTIQQVCHRYNLGLYKHSAELPSVKHPPTPQYSVFYIDRAHKLSWCPIYKAASTTFLYNFLILGGYTEQFLTNSNKQLSDLARKVYPELEYSEAEQAFHDTLKLLVVRHPFERLLSAYRDKLENVQVGHNHGTLHYYRRYGRRIVKKYRQGGNSTKTWTILSQDQYYWPPNKTRPAGVEPTFQEFVRYLTDMDIVLYSDDHWIPYYLYCTPCLLKYDIIAKVESLLRDQVYVIRSAGLQEQVRPRWRHKTKEESNEIAKRYFSQLTKEQVLKLYEKYKVDFELFDYKADLYLEYAH
uniref:Carbohydrate sulfotransferase n=2 Tax=Timema TaxID=61471 RepID=A0A7R9H1X0_TIMPO|nr:unnamed protein product [Timema poppensis]